MQTRTAKPLPLVTAPNRTTCPEGHGSHPETRPGSAPKRLSHRTVVHTVSSLGSAPVLSSLSLEVNRDSENRSSPTSDGSRTRTEGHESQQKPDSSVTHATFQGPRKLTYQITDFHQLGRPVRQSCLPPALLTPLDLTLTFHCTCWGLTSAHLRI